MKCTDCNEEIKEEYVKVIYYAETGQEDRYFCNKFCLQLHLEKSIVGGADI